MATNSISPVLTRIAAYNAQLEESPQTREQGLRHAHGQHPHTMVVTCCDSRVLPHRFLGDRMGELFIHRNAGNIIPHPSLDGGPLPVASEAAEDLELGVEVFRVKELVICGHSDCGAMKLRRHGMATSHNVPNLQRKLESATIPEMPTQLFVADTLLCDIDQDSQRNAVNQLANAHAYPCVHEAIAQNRLQVHAIWVDLDRGGEVLQFDPRTGQFAPATADATQFSAQVGIPTRTGKNLD